MTNRLMRTSLDYLFKYGTFIYDYFAFQSYWEDHVALLLPLFKNKKGPFKVLDVGCGPGVSAFVLADKLPRGSEIVGIDIEDNMIETARRNHEKDYSHFKKIRFIHGSAADMPFNDKTFDVVVGNSFLYLLDDPEQILVECRRVLKPSGVIGFVEPNRRGNLAVNLLSEPAKTAGKIKEDPVNYLKYLGTLFGWRLVSSIKGQMTAGELEKNFARAGFKNIQCSPVLKGLGLFCQAGCTLKKRR